MPRKFDSCMFCTDEEPCEAHEPKIKKTASRKKITRSVQNVELPPVQVAPTADLKAAMKAAAQGQDSVSLNTTSTVQPILPESAVPQVRQQVEKSVDPEFIRALAVLEPILHPAELQAHHRITDLPAYRALKWKLKNRGNNDC